MRTKEVVVYFKEEGGQIYSKTYNMPLKGVNIMILALEEFDKEFNHTDFYTIKVEIL
jgi:hypothetical protein